MKGNTVSGLKMLELTNRREERGEREREREIDCQCCIDDQIGAAVKSS